MCKYCDFSNIPNDRNDTNIIEEHNDAEMYLTQSIDEENYWFLHLILYSNHNPDELFSIPINYCPFCGRLLNFKHTDTYDDVIAREG